MNEIEKTKKITLTELSTNEHIDDARFRKAYNDIHALQKRVFGQTWPRDIDELAQRYTSLLHVEIVESLQQTNFKMHQKKHPIDMDKFGEEIIDIMIYACAYSGLAFDNFDQFLNALEQKVNKNKTRQDWEINKQNGHIKQ